MSPTFLKKVGQKTLTNFNKLQQASTSFALLLSFRKTVLKKRFYFYFKDFKEKEEKK